MCPSQGDFYRGKIQRNNSNILRYFSARADIPPCRAESTSAPETGNSDDISKPNIQSNADTKTGNKISWQELFSLCARNLKSNHHFQWGGTMREHTSINGSWHMQNDLQFIFTWRLTGHICCRRWRPLYSEDRAGAAPSPSSSVFGRIPDGKKHVKLNRSRRGTWCCLGRFKGLLRHFGKHDYLLLYD